MIKLLLGLILSVLIVVAQGQVGGGQGCVVYIDAVSNNTNSTCGSAQNGNNPCQSLQYAILACENLRSTSDMTFYFAGGVQIISNDVPISIYNQTIVISGNQNNEEVNPTILEFTNVDGVVMDIIQGHKSKDTDITSITISNSLISGLANSVIQSLEETVGSVQITISNCIFKDSLFTSNSSSLFILNYVDLTMSQTTFTGLNYTASNDNIQLNQYGLILNSAFSNITIQNCTFNNITGNTSLFSSSNSDNQLILNQNQFTNNNIYQVLTTQSQSNQISSNFFINNQQINLYGSSSFLLNSYSSTVFAYYNTFVSNTGFGILSVVSNSINTSITNQFVYNNMTTSTTSKVGLFFWASSNSTLYIHYNNIQHSNADNYMVMVQHTTFQFISNNLISNNGPILGIAGDSKAYIQNNNIIDSNFGNILVNCKDSDLIMNNDNQNNSNIISPSTKLSTFVCDGCTFNNNEQCPTTETTTPTNNNNNKTKYIVIGIIIGFAVLGTIVAVVIYYKRRYHHKHHHYDPLLSH